MTPITFDNISDYLNAGAPLDDVFSMIEMLQAYKEEVLDAIANWTELIPEVPDDRFLPGYNWGNASRHDDLKAIVTWLMKMGYAVRLPKLRAGDDECTWEVVKDDRLGRLHWECDRFFVEGLPKPEESPNDANRVPECLSCWE